MQAYFSKIVVSKDGFDWYIRINGDPDKPLHCQLEGKRRSTTKIAVTQDFSPALEVIFAWRRVILLRRDIWLSPSDIGLRPVLEANIISLRQRRNITKITIKESKQLGL